MTNERKNKLENIKLQIELLKHKLNNMDKILSLQEETLNTIDEKTKSLLFESQFSPSPEEKIKQVFSNKKIPKIVFK